MYRANDMSKGNAKIHTQKKCRKPDNFWHGVDWQMFPVIIRKRCDKVLSGCHRGKNVFWITPGLLQAGETSSLHFFPFTSLSLFFVSRIKSLIVDPEEKNLSGTGLSN